MSNNELAFVQNQLPAHLRGTDTGHTEFDDMGGATIPRIKVRVTGIQIVEGETVLAEVPAGNTIPVVIVGASPVSRSYYKNNYTAGEASMPDCRSYDGVTPDANVEHPVSSRCDTCPMNAKGSSANQAGGRACRFRQNLAVISPNMPDKLLRLPISATSIFPKDDYDNYQAFRPFVAKLRANKLQPFHVITDVRQNPKSEQTHTVFQPTGYVSQEILDAVMAHREDEAALDMIYGKFENGVSNHDQAEEDRKDAEAFDKLHGAPPTHIKQETAQPATPAKESGNSTSAESVKTTEAMLGYTPFEPHEFAGETTWWKGITVTRNLGSDTVNVVIELAGDQPLPDEEWEEVSVADFTAYTAQVKAFEDAQAKADVKPPRRRRQQAEATTEVQAEATTTTPPRRERKATETVAAGEEAGTAAPTNDRALANALDTMFDDEE